jgi:hypothetical protein
MRCCASSSSSCCGSPGFQIDAIVRAGFIPARFGSELILPPGAMVPFLLTPLSSALLHGGVLHIAFNIVVLLFIGRQLEAPLGSKAMAVLLLAGAYGGALAQFLADPQSAVPMIGASGAISALIAVFALIFSRSRARHRSDTGALGARFMARRGVDRASVADRLCRRRRFRHGCDLGARRRLSRGIVPRAAVAALAFRDAVAPNSLSLSWA